ELHLTLLFSTFDRYRKPHAERSLYQNKHSLPENRVHFETEECMKTDFHALLETSQAMALLEVNGETSTIAFVNLPFELLTGWRFAEVAGLRTTDLWTEDGAIGTPSNMQEELRRGVPSRGMVLCRR